MATVEPEPKPQQPSLARRVWGGFLAVAGVVAGLAVIVYVIGAATLWLALRNSGYSPDVGIEHESRNQLIGLGLRGIVAVGLLSVVLAAVAAAIILIPQLRNKADNLRFRYAALGAIALLLAASFINWRWLALAIALAAVILSISFRLRFPRYTQQWFWLALVIAAVFTAIAWEYGGTVHVAAVQVRPNEAMPLYGIYSPREKGTCQLDGGKSGRSAYTYIRGKLFWIAGKKTNPCQRKPAMSAKAILDELRTDCSIPYFGENGSFVYVGAVNHAWEPSGNACFWNMGPAIVELRRDQVRLRFLQHKTFLNQKRHRPIGAGWRVLRSFAAKFG